jgi:hypothetical protein
MSSTQNGNAYGQWVLGSTGAGGSFTLTGVEAYNNIGNWTETWYVGGAAASPTLVFTVGPAPGDATLYCSAMTPPYIGTYDESDPPGHFTVTAGGTALPSITGANFLIWNDTQSWSAADSLPGNNFSGQWAESFSSASFDGILGSYAVLAQLNDANNNKLLCPIPAFFAVTNRAGFPPSKTQTSCNGAAALWNESSNPTAIWSLNQNANSLSGTVSVDDNCGGYISYSATGTYLSGNSFSVTASGPSPSTFTCGGQPYDAASSVVEQWGLNLSVCNTGTASWTSYFPDGDNGTGTNSISSSAQLPASESSAYNAFDTHGFSSEARFTGALAAPTSGSYGVGERYGGRAVQESAASITDGCNDATGSAYVNPVTSQDLQSSWYLAADGSYGDDLIGYGPAAARYYQTVAGNCSLQVTQLMLINTGSGNSAQYAQNAITVALTPTTVSVTRQNATGSKNPFPVQ